MAQVPQATLGYRGPGAVGAGGPNRLFFACFVSMFATSFGFMVRALLLNDFGMIFNLSETQKGAIQGAGLFPFAISIVLFSLFIDRIGYGKIMVFAWVGHVCGTILMIFSKNFEMLYAGTLILALANGAIEAVVNPVTATLFPTKKTHYLNILHAGWPGGLVLAGLIAIAMGSLDWRWKCALVLIPTVIYGVLLLGQRFPIQERVAAGVSYRDMMREFGAAGCLIITYFLVQALLTVASVFLPAQVAASAGFEHLSTWLPPVVAALTAIPFWVGYRSIGRPMFVFMLLIMILLATTELGVDSWVTDLMTPVFGAHAGWILVYTSAIMFVLRFFAGPLIHKINPLGLLLVGSATACIGLVSLSFAGGAVALVFVAATLYGCGKSYFWPTTLGIVSEQFPKGGALTLNAMGGMGMIAVGVLGGPMLGAFLDHNVDHQLRRSDPAAYSIVANPTPVTTYGMTHHTIDESKLTSLSKSQRDEVQDVRAKVKQGSLRYIAVLPATMFCCYLLLVFYFISKGGYRVQHLAMSGEQASGGVEGAVR
jgi:MFS family permease